LAFLSTDDGSGQPLEKVSEVKITGGIHIQQKGFNIRFLTRYKGDNFYSNSNPNVPVDEFGHVIIDEITTMDLFVSKTFSFEGFAKQATISLFAENLADKKYKESFAPWVIQDTARIPGRIFGFKLSGKF